MMTKEQGIVLGMEAWVMDTINRIGFVLESNSETDLGVVRKYKYRPDYMGENHYTLIVFDYKKPTMDISSNPLYLNKDYRLYIHNSEGFFVDSPFQIGSPGNFDLLRRKFRQTFVSEMRNFVLEEILT
jgi:hypothetical protein